MEHIKEIKFVSPIEDETEGHVIGVRYYMNHDVTGPIRVDLEYGRDMDIFDVGGRTYKFKEGDDRHEIMGDIFDAIKQTPEYNKYGAIDSL